MILSVIVPMLLGFLLANYFSDWRWIHYPVHSMIESIGSLSAVTISVLMVLMVNKGHLSRHYIWVACALIAMGILDGAHAALHAGVSFVWLHSVATMIGGLVFAAVWLPESWLTPQRQRVLIISVTSIALFISLVSITLPGMLPTMVVDGEFSIFAELLNLSGGVGFLIGTAYFVHHKLKIRKVRPAEQHKNEDLVFANHCLLFGIAGLLFELSVIWDAGWWWWHILRLAAYLVVLVYFFVLFKQQQDTLSINEEMLNHAYKHLEQRVYERTKELEKANNAKSEFLSSMSHELRTPMNAILGFGQLLELDEKLQSEHKASVGEIMLAGKHLMELISEVLDLAKIEGGKIDINIEDANISSIVCESLTLVAPLANPENIELINNSANDVDYIARVDKLRFKQVFINLLSNAIKYNNKDGKVYIDIEHIDNNKIRLSVKDTGPGITKEKQEKLFMPFERLGYENKNIEGTGIGLVLSKKLMLLMDGTIGIHSIPGEGSTFFIEFNSKL